MDELYGVGTMQAEAGILFVTSTKMNPTQQSFYLAVPLANFEHTQKREDSRAITLVILSHVDLRALNANSQQFGTKGRNYIEKRVR